VRIKERNFRYLNTSKYSPSSIKFCRITTDNNTKNKTNDLSILIFLEAAMLMFKSKEPKRKKFDSDNPLARVDRKKISSTRQRFVLFFRTSIRF
jgi:hypothetical protein